MFQIEPGYIIWESIAALTVLLVLEKCLRPSIRRALHDRAEALDRSLRHAELAREAAEKALRAVQHSAVTLESEKKKIRLSGQAAAAQLIALSEETAHRMAERIRRQMVMEIQQGKDQAIQEIQMMIADAVTRSTAAVIEQHLDRQKQSELVDTAIHSLPVESLRRSADKPGSNISTN